jgi:FG-GAP-like repeat/FG-GAP repeat
MTRTRRVPRAEMLEDRRLMTVAFAPATTYPVAAGVLNVVTGDFNGDGVPDVVSISPQFNGTGQGGSITALLGNGKGGFSSAVDTEIPALNQDGGVAVGDFNGDGKLDLAVITASLGTAQPPMVVELLGNGDGTFRVGPMAPAANSQATLVAGDFNGDGVSDIAVAYGPTLNFGPPFNQPDPANGTVHLYLGSRNGTLTDSGVIGNLGASFRAPALVAADFNGDGKLDLAGSTTASPQVTVLLGNGDGTFRNGGVTPIAAGSDSLVAADFNGDGKTDLAALDPLSGGVVVLIGRGDGTFSGGPGFQFGFGSQAATLVASDFNGDGKIDLATAIYPLNEVRIAPGTGSGTFGAIVAVPAPGTSFNGATDLAATDLNGDGRADLVTVTGSPPEIGVLLASGGATSAGDGPRVTSATVDPHAGRIVLTFGDDAAGLDASSLANLTNYDVIGPYSQLGRHPSQITGISVSPATATGATTVALTIGGGRPFPHGRYILLVKSGGIVDRAGRALDGEYTGVLPSGNGIPGGDFQARFQFNRKALLPLAAPAPAPPVVARRAAAHAKVVRGAHR